VAAELRDRFGAPPAQVQDLLFAVKIRALGARGGVEAVSVEMGHVVVRLFAGMQFDAPRLETVLKGQGQVARSQLRLNQKRLGASWRATLEAVLRRVARI